MGQCRGKHTVNIHGTCMTARCIGACDALLCPR